MAGAGRVAIVATVPATPDREATAMTPDLEENQLARVEALEIVVRTLIHTHPHIRDFHDTLREVRKMLRRGANPVTDPSTEELLRILDSFATDAVLPTY